MNSEWCLTTLRELVSVKHGFAFKGEYFVDEKTSLQLTTPGNFSIGGGFRCGKGKYYAGPVPSDYVLSAGDLIVTMTDLSKAADTLGYAAVIPKTVGTTWLHNQRVGLVRPRNGSKICMGYIHYLMRSPAYRHMVVSTATGSTVKHTSPDRILAYEFSLPSFPEQKQIGEMLSFLDARITLLHETKATLEAIAQALFKSWFVDFDPVRAKVEGLEPEGMDAATAGLFSDSFEESELGLVPKGWKLVPFGELLIHTIGGDWGDETPSEKNDTRVAIIRGTDIPDLQSGAANRVPLRYTSTKKLATRKLQDGDLVLEVSGGSKDQPTGRALYLTEALLGQFDCPVEPASFCRLLRPIDRNIGLLLAQHLTYIYGIGKTWEYQNQSTGIANFQTTHFLESELVAVPPREVLAVFADVVRSIVDRGHLSQIQNLASLRDTLLPRLISGQLRLPEAEVMVEEVCA